MLGIVFAAAVLSSPTQGQTYLLRTRLKLGEEAHYRVTTKFDDFPETVTTYRTKVVDVSDGCFVVKTTYSALKVGSQKTQGPRTPTAWTTLNSRGEPIKIVQEGSGAVPFGDSGMVFPKEPIRVGAQWFPKTKPESIYRYVEYTLKGVREIKGQKVATIGIAMGDPKPELRTSMTGYTGQVLLDLATGMMLSMEFEIPTKIQERLVPLRMSIKRFR